MALELPPEGILRTSYREGLTPCRLCSAHSYCNDPSRILEKAKKRICGQCAQQALLASASMSARCHQRVIKCEAFLPGRLIDIRVFVTFRGADYQGCAFRAEEGMRKKIKLSVGPGIEVEEIEFRDGRWAMMNKGLTSRLDKLEASKRPRPTFVVWEGPGWC